MKRRLSRRIDENGRAIENKRIKRGRPLQAPPKKAALADRNRLGQHHKNSQTHHVSQGQFFAFSGETLYLHATPSKKTALEAQTLCAVLDAQEPFPIRRLGAENFSGVPNERNRTSRRELKSFYINDIYGSEPSRLAAVIGERRALRHIRTRSQISIFDQFARRGLIKMRNSGNPAARLRLQHAHRFGVCKDVARLDDRQHVAQRIERKLLAGR